MVDLVKLGKRIREERTRLNLTQEKLAELVGMSEAFFGYIERGQRGLHLNNLSKIANSLGVTLDYLLSDSIPLEEDINMAQIRQVLQLRTAKEKKMALNILSALFSNIDEINGDNNG